MANDHFLLPFQIHSENSTLHFKGSEFIKSHNQEIPKPYPFFTDQSKSFSERQSRPGNRLRPQCFKQTCNQVVTGRRLTYQRATRIIQDEEYLTATDNILKKIKRKKFGKLHLIIIILTFHSRLLFYSSFKQ
jgi:hypothetical protein